MKYTIDRASKKVTFSTGTYTIDDLSAELTFIATTYGNDWSISFEPEVQHIVNSPLVQHPGIWGGSGNDHNITYTTTSDKSELIHG